MTATAVVPGMKLSDRERQVLTGIAHGYTDSRIARDLGIHTHTVVTHARHLRIKLGAKNRANAVAIGFAKGYLRMEARRAQD